MEGFSGGRRVATHGQHDFAGAAPTQLKNRYFKAL
jgi:hypothetical protein